MAYEKNTWTDVYGETPICAEKLNKMEQGIEDADKMATPTGGTTGQVLVKNSDIDGDTKWADKSEVDNSPVIIRSGSKIISATDSNGAQLFTKAEMQSLFGITDGFSTNRVSGCVVNGDTGAFSGNFIGLRIASSNSNIYVLLDQAVTGTVNMRCNYTLFYQK